MADNYDHSFDMETEESMKPVFHDAQTDISEAGEGEAATDSKINELRTALSEVLGEENLTGQHVTDLDLETKRDEEPPQKLTGDQPDDQNISNNAVIVGIEEENDSLRVKSFDDNDDNLLGSEEKMFKYTAPIEDPYEKAWKYLSKHNILALFGVGTHKLAC